MIGRRRFLRLLGAAMLTPAALPQEVLEGANAAAYVYLLDNELRAEIDKLKMST